ncbi:adenylyltransferase/cytidyltransferase family protein [Zooshikella ganghwensis]|uniref:nicotinate-nucleotide adenylyltransferase n=1 Tax=Zooshikella ganghwensis TaxID=202772 RepID=A0A4P9VTV4_9GAMM|nr:adenylyltransferase/cytidyltransferase family protein [Zooshikella ganghwensis]RDH46309.1 nicotinate-nicotinamide nucleotide adenylyltransferase [Zooshikella ganghwensis]
MTQDSIGVFGSAFNPPTCGHLDAIKQAAPHFTTILLLPAAAHAFNKQMLDFHSRLALLKCFVKDLPKLSCKIEICGIEQDMLSNHPQKPVYTYDVLKLLSEQYAPSAKVQFILGPDNAKPEIWQKFYKADEIKQQWGTFVVQEQEAVRSTLAREKLQSFYKAEDEKRTHIHQQLSKILTPGVLHYIQQHQLYQA